MAGGHIRQLARSPDALKLWLQAFREALRALRAVGVPLRPSATRLVEWIPAPIMIFALRRFFDSRLTEVGAQPHMETALDEMKELADELRMISRQAGLPSSASDALYAEVDARFQASYSKANRRSCTEYGRSTARLSVQEPLRGNQVSFLLRG